ncbi:MAG: LysR family transcriptional regulator [Ilumatobacter sp.]|nr:LysR family transcriptional regulator [Ilumatobacter sp.]
MELKIRQLEVFKAVMETGSVTAAAARLNCTQPAVSVALSKFERSSGLSLFDRTRGRFAPTPEGEALYSEVERGLSSLARITGKARELREGRVGHLMIAADGVSRLLAVVVAEFQRRHGDVTVEMFLRNSKEIVTWVGSQQLDVGIVEMPVHWPGVAYEPFTQRCVCIVPADHPLADRAVITPADLVGEPLIGIADHHPIDTQVSDAFQDAGVRSMSRVAGAYFETCRLLVQAGAGVAVVDAITGDDTIGGGVVARPFEPAISYDMAIVTPARPGPSPLARLFVDEVRATLERFRGD